MHNELSLATAHYANITTRYCTNDGIGDGDGVYGALTFFFSKAIFGCLFCHFSKWLCLALIIHYYNFKIVSEKINRPEGKPVQLDNSDCWKWDENKKQTNKLHCIWYSIIRKKKIKKERKKCNKWAELEQEKFVFSLFSFCQFFSGYGTVKSEKERATTEYAPIIEIEFENCKQAF